MTTEEYLLICLAEECSEIIKETSKILRFGLNDHPPREDGVVKPNEERLSDEINDLMGVIELLKQKGIKIVLDADKIFEKQAKVISYMKYSREKGIL